MGIIWTKGKMWKRVGATVPIRRSHKKIVVCCGKELSPRPFVYFAAIFWGKFKDQTNKLCGALWGTKPTVPHLPSVRERAHDERRASPVVIWSYP